MMSNQLYMIYTPFIVCIVPAVPTIPRVKEIKALSLTVCRKFSVAQHDNHLFVSCMCSRCLHCALFDTIACRQTLYILFSRPPSPLGCHMHRLHGWDAPRWRSWRFKSLLKQTTTLGFCPAGVPMLGTIYSEANDNLSLRSPLTHFIFIVFFHWDGTCIIRWNRMHTTSLFQFEQLHIVTVITLTGSCCMKTL